MKKINLLFIVFFSIKSICLAQNVSIGNQVWCTKNLNVSKFRNGDPIPEAKTDEEWKKAAENKQPAWCYYNNNPANAEKYGKIYNGYAVRDSRGLAPVDYHIPTDRDWGLLADYLGLNMAGFKMKSKYGWSGFRRVGEIFSGNGSNSSGFSGTSGGNRASNGAFSSIGERCSWWTYAEYKPKNVSLKSFGDRLFLGTAAQLGEGCYVRCVLDNASPNE